MFCSEIKQKNGVDGYKLILAKHIYHQSCLLFLIYIYIYIGFTCQLLTISFMQVRLLVGVLKSVGAGDLTAPDGMFLLKTFDVIGYSGFQSDPLFLFNASFQ